MGLIDEQAAIDALGEEPEVWSGRDEYAQGRNNQWHYDVNALKAVPSVQPSFSQLHENDHTAEVGKKGEQCEYYAICRHGRDEDKLRARLGFCEYCNEDADGYVKPIEKNCHAFIRFGMNGWELDLKANGWHGSAKVRSGQSTVRHDEPAVDSV